MTIWQYLTSFVDTLNHPFNRRHKALTIFRILYWKINQWFFHLPAFVTLDKNIKCVCYPDSSYGGMVVYNRWAEYDVMKHIVSTLTPTSIYVDVGANIGDTTVIAANYTKGKIFAFEPSPIAYPRLCENVRLNSLEKQIVTEPLALSDRSGTVPFTEMPTSETSHIGSEEVGGRTIKVKSITLDEYAARNAVTTIDLLKIDVEGAEMLVLRGAAKLLEKGKIKHLFLELNSNSHAYGYNNSDVVDFLKNHGYKLPKLPKNINNRIINIHAETVR